MDYRIFYIDHSDGWIFINDSQNTEPLDAFPKMVKRIATAVQGKIINVGYLQYRITNIPVDLIFQCDDCFGIVVISSPQNIAQALKFLAKFDVAA